MAESIGPLSLSMQLFLVHRYISCILLESLVTFACTTALNLHIMARFSSYPQTLSWTSFYLSYIFPIHNQKQEKQTHVKFPQYESNKIDYIIVRDVDKFLTVKSFRFSSTVRVMGRAPDKKRKFQAKALFSLAISLGPSFFKTFLDLFSFTRN